MCGKQNQTDIFIRICIYVIIEYTIFNHDHQILLLSLQANRIWASLTLLCVQNSFPNLRRGRATLYNQHVRSQHHPAKFYEDEWTGALSN